MNQELLDSYSFQKMIIRSRLLINLEKKLLFIKKEKIYYVALSKRKIVVINKWHFLQNSFQNSWGLCTNHVDRIWGIFDPPPPPYVDTFTKSVKQTFEQPPSPSLVYVVCIDSIFVISRFLSETSFLRMHYNLICSCLNLAK